MGRSMFGEVEGGNELTWLYVEQLTDLCVFRYSVNVAG